MDLCIVILLCNCVLCSRWKGSKNSSWTAGLCPLNGVGGGQKNSRHWGWNNYKREVIKCTSRYWDRSWPRVCSTGPSRSSCSCHVCIQEKLEACVCCDHIRLCRCRHPCLKWRVFQLWKKVLRSQADLCSSVFCGLTMGGVYWFSVGDRDEADRHSGIKRGGKKGSPCVCLCTGKNAHISQLLHGPVKVKRNLRHCQRIYLRQTQVESVKADCSWLKPLVNHETGVCIGVWAGWDEECAGVAVQSRC